MNEENYHRILTNLPWCKQHESNRTEEKMYNRARVRPFDNRRMHIDQQKNIHSVDQQDSILRTNVNEIRSVVITKTLFCLSQHDTKQMNHLNKQFNSTI